jgi:hypothetical protein
MKKEKTNIEEIFRAICVPYSISTRVVDPDPAF